MGHRQAGSLEPTFDIEPLIRLTAIQNGFIASNSLSHSVKSLNDSQTKLLALLVFGNGDIFDMAYQAQVVDEFALDDHGTSPDNGIGFVTHHEYVVGVISASHEVVAGIECLFRELADRGQDAQGR